MLTKKLVISYHILTSALRIIFHEIAGKNPVKNLANLCTFLASILVKKQL